MPLERDRGRMAVFQGSLGHTGEHAMYGTITTLVTVLYIAAYTLLGPAKAEPLHSASAPVGCTGDYVCGDDPSVVATWPLERWATIRRVRQQSVARSAAHAKLPTTAKQ
jgi:hypothetical protein